MSDSTFSLAPTPFQGAYMPWAYHHTQRMFGGPDAMSVESSPSHEPVPLPSRLPPHLTGAAGGGGGRGKTMVGGQRGKLRTESKLRREASGSVSPPRKPPPRVESTQPRDTSPEPSSSGEETAREDSYPTSQSSYFAPTGGGVAVNGHQGYQGYDGRWAGAIVPIGEEEADDDAKTKTKKAAEKRRRRWEIGWETLTQAFQNLDRQTDTTMASPADSSKLHMISSRSIRRTPVLSRSPAMHQLKASFRGVAQHRRQTRTRKIPIIDHILTASSAGGDGSDGGSSESREGDESETGVGRGAEWPRRAEEHVRIQNGEVERRDDEDASREGKRRVYAQAALWRKAMMMAVDIPYSLTSLYAMWSQKL
ncbi:hypothetical protein JOM56_015184 [Amanita muscaria]